MALSILLVYRESLAFSAELSAYQVMVDQVMEDHYYRGVASGCMKSAMVKARLDGDSAELYCGRMLEEAAERDWFNTMGR